MKSMCRDKVSVEEEAAGIALACRAFPLTLLRIRMLNSPRRKVKRKYGFV